MAIEQVMTQLTEAIKELNVTIDTFAARYQPIESVYTGPVDCSPGPMTYEGMPVDSCIAGLDATLKEMAEYPEAPEKEEEEAPNAITAKARARYEENKAEEAAIKAARAEIEPKPVITPAEVKITEETLIAEVRKNISRRGSDDFAVDIINKYQEHAKFSNLSEKHYAGIFAEVKADNDGK